MVRIQRRSIRGCTTALTVAAVAAAGCFGPAKEPRTANVQRDEPTSRPVRVSAFGAELLWRAPSSRAAKRMQGPSPGEEDWPPARVYYAVWDGGGRAGAEPLLVALQQNPGDMFGAVWNVEVLDRDGRVLRRGETRCGEYEEPYCLMEIKSDTPGIPAGYRGRWVLAVAFLNDYAVREKQRQVDEADARGEWLEWEKIPEPTRDERGRKLPAFDPAKPLLLDVRDLSKDLWGNVVSVDPLRWDEDADDFKGGVGV